MNKLKNLTFVAKKIEDEKIALKLKERNTLPGNLSTTTYLIMNLLETF